MTIKRRLSLSNIRMVLISFGAMWLAGTIVRLLLFGPGRPDYERLANLHDFFNIDLRVAIWIMIFALFVIIISIINNIITYRMTKRIIQPLEPLGEGVRQIQVNNFSHRINYNGNDEFRPVCDAFNEMAAKLETTTAQQKKDEANRRELIAGISHDLRTPLTSIIGCIEGIETGVASSPEMKEQYFRFIKTEAANMKQIIEQLFLFSKLDMDEFPLNLRRIDISLAISEMVEDCLKKYESRGFFMQLAEMPKGVFVDADVNLLRNVIINIFENSVQYKTKKQGKMEISASVIDNSILLRFADDGPGIQADMLSKIFDIFFRSDPSRNKKGSGLGLAISAKIINSMGGSIHAEPSPLGGLAVVIRLPVLQSEAG